MNAQACGHEVALAGSQASYASKLVEDVLHSGGLEICLFAVTAALALLVRGRARGRRASSRCRAATTPPTGSLAAANVPVAPWWPQPRQSGASELAAVAEPLGIHPLVRVVADTVEMRIPTLTALARYAEFKAIGAHHHFERDLAGLKYSSVDFYKSLVQCAGRGGRSDMVAKLLDDMEEAGIRRPLSLYESAMKLLAGKRCFAEAMDVYERVERDGMKASPVTLSCLVSFAAELGLKERAVYYFNKLSDEEVPSVRACMNILRIYGKELDWAASVKLLDALWAENADTDALMLNIVLSTGVAAGYVKEARELLRRPEAQRVADAVSHNIVLKGFAQKGDVDGTLGLVASMTERGLVANLITFNTAIDAAVRGRRPEDAWRLLGQIHQQGLKPDKCTCSTLAKSLQHQPTSERLRATLELLDAVADECGYDLAKRVLSGALDVATRLADAALAARTLEKMRAMNMRATPEELRAVALITTRTSAPRAAFAPPPTPAPWRRGAP